MPFGRSACALYRMKIFMRVAHKSATIRNGNTACHGHYHAMSRLRIERRLRAKLLHRKRQRELVGVCVLIWAAIVCAIWG